MGVWLPSPQSSVSDAIAAAVSEHPPAAVTVTGAVPEAGDRLKEQVKLVCAAADPPAIRANASAAVHRSNLQARWGDPDPYGFRKLM
jgi:hypothetical protein